MTAPFDDAVPPPLPALVPATGKAPVRRRRTDRLPEHFPELDDPALLARAVARLDGLTDTLRVYLDAAAEALAPNTLRALRSDLRLFLMWCEHRGLPALPASAETVQAYVRAVGAVHKPSTVTRYLSSIATWHTAAGLVNPCADARVVLARRAQRRAHGTRRRQAEGLGEARIDGIIAAVDAAADGGPLPPRALRDVALLLTARDTLCRASELVALRWEDLAPAGDGAGTILVRRGKADQEGEGRVAYLARDTMEALAEWRAAQARLLTGERARRAAGKAPAVKGAGHRAQATAVPFGELEARLFCSLDRAGLTPLSPTSVARIVRARATQGGETRRFSAHSTRVGAAQDLVAAGYDLPAIQQAGGWKSPVMVARYAERLLAERGAVARHRAGRQRRPNGPTEDPAPPDAG